MITILSKPMVTICFLPVETSELVVSTANQSAPSSREIKAFPDSSLATSSWTTFHEPISVQPNVPGMTANLDILTAQKNDALIIPQRAITSANGDKFVDIGGTTVKVITGLRGSDGNIEILEGLKEGDKIVISQ